MNQSIPSEFYVMIDDVNMSDLKVTWHNYQDDKKHTVKLYKDSHNRHYFKAKNVFFYIRHVTYKSPGWTHEVKSVFVAYLRNGDTLYPVWDGFEPVPYNMSREDLLRNNSARFL